MFAVAPPAAEPVLRGSKGSVYAVSSFGVDATTFGPGFSPGEHFSGDRYRELDFKHQYPLCKRHDGKVYDFQGRLIRSGNYALTQPFIGSSMPATYVPMDQRRPSNPYRLARLIVRSFTTLVFGEGRFPRFASDDQDTQDFVEALAEAAEAAVRFTQARNIGGSVGTVGVSWRFWNGTPRLKVHNGKRLIAHSWIDRENFEVEHVTEITQTSRVEYDAKKKKRVRRYYWCRRDWTPNADVQFVDAPADDPNEDVEWIVDEDKTFVHGDGFPHFVWIRNGADDDDGTEDDGQCDFEGQFESLDGLDVLASVLSSGTVRNLDPTLVLAISKAQLAKNDGNVQKGSGNAISVGEGGSASYLELGGTATAAGINLLDRQRAMVLETAQCVVPSTAELTSAGTSAVSQKMLFAPMLSATGVHRTEYGSGMVRVFDQMLRSARRRYPELDAVTGEPAYPVVTNEEGEDEEVEFFLDLPPKVVSENELDDNGSPTGRVKKTVRELKPGNGKLRLKWPEYFEPTSQDVQTKATAVTAAAGGKATLSQQTGVEIMAGVVNVDPSKEWERVSAEARAAAAAEAGMFQGTGGEVSHRDELPPGAKPLLPKATPPSSGSEPSSTPAAPEE